MIERYTGIILIILMAVLGATTVLRTSFDPSVGSSLADGSLQQSLERDFDAALPHKDISLHAWNAFRYHFFGEIAQGALKGEDGWLFTEEEFISSPEDAENMSANLEEIIGTSRELATQGAILIVALLPDKARVYADRYGHRRPPFAENRYEAARATLIAAGIDVPNLYSALLEARSTAPTFLKRDTHWTPFGARVVAQTLAETLTSSDLPTTPFQATQSTSIAHKGDLINFVETGPFSEQLGLTAERLDQFDVFPAAGSMGLFDDPLPIHVALVGTSFSADPKWQFADFLRLEAQVDILNLANTGQGPFVPMRNFTDGLRRGGDSFSFIIWEIPERYLATSEW